MAIETGFFGIEERSPEPDPFYMVVDRPFLLVICDNGTGSILFIGAVNKID